MTKEGGTSSTTASSGMSTFRVFQITMALLLFSTVAYIAKFTTVWTSPVFRPTADDVQFEHMVHLQEVLETRGKNRFFVPDFEAAEAFLRQVDLKEGPMFVLLMSSEVNGSYWCNDCARAKQPFEDALARAPPNTRVLEVSVGAPRDWNDDYNPFRTKSTFHIRKIPALLKYEGNLKTSHLVSEQFVTKPELLNFVFGTKIPMPRPPKIIRSADEMLAFVKAYKGDYPLFLSFTSGTNPHTGRLWCPFCDIADLPIQHYFETAAPENAQLVRVVVADSYGAWKENSNPFRKQFVVRVSAIPTLVRVSKAQPTDEPFVREYLPLFEDTKELQKFFQAKS
ncbi:hypothetical protein AC1031_002715 [Aphanomyces cochlioides]|nr:hypothetical protein AC1031_002715 [Aphanomyces cochlioides]